MDVAHGCSGVTYPYLTEGDLVKRHDRRPHFSTVKKVLSFFSPLKDKKGLYLVSTLLYVTEELKEKREEENQKIFLDQSAKIGSPV